MPIHSEKLADATMVCMQPVARSQGFVLRIAHQWRPRKAILGIVAVFMASLSQLQSPLLAAPVDDAPYI